MTAFFAAWGVRFPTCGTDGSCIRLRPEHSNHVCRYDFAFDRTHDGRRLRMLTVIDEFTQECPAINDSRRMTSDLPRSNGPRSFDLPAKILQHRIAIEHRTVSSPNFQERLLPRALSRSELRRNACAFNVLNLGRGASHSVPNSVPFPIKKFDQIDRATWVSMKSLTDTTTAAGSELLFVKPQA